MLSDNRINTQAIQYGIQNESVATTKFQELTGLHVISSGLYVDIKYGFLGASPDGMI